MNIPIHYRDDDKTVCPESGKPGWKEGETCSRGCSGSKAHYPNDGHDGCQDPIVRPYFD